MSGLEGLHAQIRILERGYERQVAEIDRLRQLVYMAHPEDCPCEICTAIRATEPDPDAIICCICDKPIEDLDNRHWLHRIGCNGGECDCDYECCADCCPVCSGNNHDGYWCDLEDEGGDE